MDDEFDELVKKGKKTVKEVDSMKQLANEVQYAILTRGLKPGKCKMYLRLLVSLEANSPVFIASHAIVLQPNGFPVAW